MDKVAIIISPNWRDYADKYLKDCLQSLAAQDAICEIKYFLIDNESTEDTFKNFNSLIEQYLPIKFDRQIIRISHNSGFAEGNNKAMKLALDQGFSRILLINMDTVSESTMLGRLLTAMEQDQSIGALQPRLMLWPDKERINSLGNATHFLGFGYCLGNGEKYEDKLHATEALQDKNIFYPSGAAVLYRAEVLNKIGLFEEEFWMYAEDQDLGWRTWLAGYKCALITEAVVYHKYEFSRSVQKYYWMDRNRLLVALKNYKLATLLLLAPAFIFMEFGLIYFSFNNGSWQQKKAVLKYFCHLSTWRYISEGRKRIRAIRTVKDAEIARMMCSSIEYQEIKSPALSLANKIFTIYWQLVSRLIIW